MKLDNVYLSRSEKYNKPNNFYFDILLILDLENVCLDTFFNVAFLYNGHSHLYIYKKSYCYNI